MTEKSVRVVGSTGVVQIGADLYSPAAQVAKDLGVPLKTVYNGIQRGELPIYRLGNYTLVQYGPGLVEWSGKRLSRIVALNKRPVDTDTGINNYITSEE